MSAKKKSGIKFKVGEVVRLKQPAKKRLEENITWTFKADVELAMIVRCQQTLGFKTELRYNEVTKTVDVIAYREVSA